MKITVFTAEGTREAGPDDLPALLAEPSTRFWVDMTGPTQADISALAEIFHFHPLAIEDSHNQQQRPKVEAYDGSLFIILNAIVCTDTITPHELDVFIGSHYLVTVHEQPEPLVTEAQGRVRRAPAHLAASAYHLFYVLADVLVDRIFPVMEYIEEASETLSDKILTEPDRTALNALFSLKREMAELWRLVWVQREMLNDLARDWDIDGRQDDLRYYMRDVVDHLTLLADMMSVQRDTITGLIDLYMSATSNRLNVVVNRLTVITIAIGVLTVFSGFYGMNFIRTWPPFEAPWGVPLVLVFMIGVVGLLLREFRRRGWF
ncbi:MAG: magnesium/cobalt transporter CorA [Anaerolineae bacterium]|nr:magnesium/cobalt transporter CorA [Anaerolineae bacterium]